MRHGLLLINLGTPQHADTWSVGRYLFDFLSDTRVIDLPRPLNYLLILGIIIPFRTKKSVRAYQKIWTPEGSPLRVNSEQLRAKVQLRLGAQYRVALGMRYGSPSLEQALEELSDCQHITVLPLYPQYASATTGSSLEKILTLIGKLRAQPSLHVIRDFYQDAGFINAIAQSIKPYLAQQDYLLFSYHGLPERQLEKSGCNPVCQLSCPPMNEKNATCYRAQCQQTMNSVVKLMDLKPEQFGMAFQSRLGKLPWIKPYTEQVLICLAEKGIKRLAIVCPSFTIDCLETLEEIGMAANAQWQKLGGETLTLIPCLNEQAPWVNAIAALVSKLNPDFYAIDNV